MNLYEVQIYMKYFLKHKSVEEFVQLPACIVEIVRKAAQPLIT